jgi:transcriptional regulator with XRE-family HTH domain
MNINQLTAMKKRRLREDAKYSQDKMAILLKKSKAYIQRIENADKHITIEEVELYADFFKIPICEIIVQHSSKSSKAKVPVITTENGIDDNTETHTTTNTRTPITTDDKIDAIYAFMLGGKI